MAIAGNFQLHPDMYRERGYAGFLEWSPTPRATVGLSSLATWARYDLVSRDPSTVRQAHGLFARWAPATPLVLLTEVDVLTQHSRGKPTTLGYASLLQADLELTRGVHAIASAEATGQQQGHGLGAGLGAAFFLAPQLEFRVDGNVRRRPTAQGGPPVYSLLGQLHLSL
jgi:hypothetical protein